MLGILQNCMHPQLIRWTANREVRGSNRGQGRNLVRDFCSTCGVLRLLANVAMMSTLTAHCQWEDETVRERTGHLPSYAVANNMSSVSVSVRKDDVYLHPVLEFWTYTHCYMH